ncbi:MAG: hypothetical protein IT270_18575 [Saprospiraceae bacterium]|nr:hypothetical protein [Saprospiraceae bacterium]
MRLIGQIEHPVLKISVFKMDGRVSVKFENAHYEQTFKLGNDERIQSLEDVQRLVDAAMAEEVLHNMQQQHRCRLAAMRRSFGEQREASVFEEII